MERIDRQNVVPFPVRPQPEPDGSARTAADILRAEIRAEIAANLDSALRGKIDRSNAMERILRLAGYYADARLLA